MKAFAKWRWLGGQRLNSLQALVKRIPSVSWQPLTNKNVPMSCRFGRRLPFVSRDAHNRFGG
jgi:hypothetical protein